MYIVFLYIVLEVFPFFVAKLTNLSFASVSDFNTAFFTLYCIEFPTVGTIKFDLSVCLSVIFIFDSLWSTIRSGVFF